MENFNAKFPIFSKIEINGEKTDPLYIFLRNKGSLFNKKTG